MKKYIFLFCIYLSTSNAFASFFCRHLIKVNSKFSIYINKEELLKSIEREPDYFIETIIIKERKLIVLLAQIVRAVVNARHTTSMLVAQLAFYKKINRNTHIIICKILIFSIYIHKINNFIFFHYLCRNYLITKRNYEQY